MISVQEDVPDFTYGFNLKTLQKYRDHWLNNYDWRKHEAELNAFPQFTTQIEGLRIHFLHVKPPANKYKTVVPLLLSHGWPGKQWMDSIPSIRQPFQETSTSFTRSFQCTPIPRNTGLARILLSRS